MFRRTATLALLALGALPASASAAQAPFGCRASAARVELGGSAVLEPVTANAATYPCRTQSAGVATVAIPDNGLPVVRVAPAGAFTYSTADSAFPVAPGAAAVASVKAVNLETSSGELTIGGPVQANASYACEHGQLVSQSQSTLQLIYFNGHPDQLPAPGSPQTIRLGGGAYIGINEKVETPDSLTERVIDVHLSDGNEIVVGEAKVTKTADAEAACRTSPLPPPVLEICPDGSVLNVVQQSCVINYQPPGSTTIIVIYVSRPFGGPSGGTVVPVPVAKRHHRSSCLNGPGPKFALVATKVGGRVYGTRLGDRILALGALERVAGIGGNDCIDGKGRQLQIWDGNGNDRIWSSLGFNRIGAGDGNDYINGRGGRDFITDGNGNDRVIGGRGGAMIDAGIGHDHLFGVGGKNRIWAGGDLALVNCGPGAHNTAFVRPRAVPYARAHGCEFVWPLR
jgi:hypothetical protein